jgi:hypothetical protein
MTIGDSGITFWFYPTTASPTDPAVQVPWYINAAAIVTMLLRLDAVPAPAHESYTMQRAADGFSASYLLTGGEFVSGGGMYEVSMRMTLGGVRLTARKPARMYVCWSGPS